MKRNSVNEAMRKPIKLQAIHAVTASVFLLSMVTLAVASERLVGGPIGYSWLALVASITPFLWSIGLVAVSRLPRTLGWSSLVLSLGVILIGTKDTWPAIISAF